MGNCVATENDEVTLKLDLEPFHHAYQVYCGAPDIVRASSFISKGGFAADREWQEVEVQSEVAGLAAMKAPARKEVNEFVAAKAPEGRSKRHGKGKHTQPKKWQIKLEGHWQDYDEQEDRILKRAWLVGQKNVRFQLRGQRYEYNFEKMRQKNLNTKKERSIRPPPGPRPPKHALLPTGPMTVVTVADGQQGGVMTVPDPNNPGQTINVHVPPGATPGSKMAVPLPAKGETVQAVQEKQKKHDEQKKKKGWSAGAKVAASGAALVGVGAIGVGGVILGDALTGGDMAETVAGIAVDAADAVADGVSDAADAVADWAPAAVDELGDFAGDAVDWLGDAGEDIGDFIMDLF